MRPLQVRIARPLALVTALVALAGLAIELVHLRTHAPVVEDLVELLSLSYEANLPTWYASSLLLACALTLGAIAGDVGSRGGPHRAAWVGLAAGFTLMSLDEAIELHEHLGGLAGGLGGSGLLYFDWVVPASALVLGLGLLFLPFLRALPPRRRRRFLLAAALYLGGALVTELPLGLVTERAGDDSAGYALIDWVEETLELVGAASFLVALAERWDQRAQAVP